MGNAAFEMLTVYMCSFHISPFFFLLLVPNTHTFFPLRKHILDITDYVVLISKKDECCCGEWTREKTNLKNSSIK